MNPKQKHLYWKQFQACCRIQKWSSHEREARRREIHRDAQCPVSSKDFTNEHFNRYLERCALLQDKIEVRDRSRECVEVSLHRLDDAIKAISGRSWLKPIATDMYDTSAHNLPTTAPPKQQGITMQPSLTNLRNTLNNRLSRLLTKIKRRQPGDPSCPPTLEWSLSVSNTAAIDAIISGKVAIRVWPSGYRQITYKEWETLRSPNAAPVSLPINPIPPTPTPIDCPF